MKNASAETVQDSINHFAYGLRFNKKTQGHQNPLSVLMTVLKRGEAWVEVNYRTSQEIALEKMIEQKKAEAERLKKLDEKLLKLEFDEWMGSLPALKKDEIVTGALNEKDKKTLHKMPQGLKEQVIRTHLINYFKSNIKIQK